MAGIIIVLLFFVVLIILAAKSQKRAHAKAAVRARKEYLKPFVQRHFQIISESKEIINKSPNAKTILSRYGAIFDNIDQLAKYEAEFPDLFSPSTKELRETFTRDKKVSLLNFAVKCCEDEIGRANAITRKASKISILDKALLNLYDIKKVIDDQEVLGKILEKENEIRAMINSLENPKQDV